MTSPSRSVLVLHEALGEQARPDELDALLQLRQVRDALHQLQCEVSTQEIGLDLGAGLSALQRAGPHCVFNLVEGLNGRGELIGLVPALLESESLSFTGSGSAAINLSSHKILAKRWMRAHGIATPDWLGAGDCAAPAGDAAQWIVKSLWEHASLGLDDSSVVRGERAAGQRIAHCAGTLGGEWFAERYIEGREFNLSLLERRGQPHVLPIAEMTFVDFPAGKPRIVGYAAKWDENAPEFSATQRRFGTLDLPGRRELQSLAEKCWSAFGLRGYARVDVRLDAAGNIWVLEVNANPCLARDAGFFAAAAEEGLPFEQVINTILQAAMPPGLPVLRRAG